MMSELHEHESPPTASDDQFLQTLAVGSVVPASVDSGDEQMKSVSTTDGMPVTDTPAASAGGLSSEYRPVPPSWLWLREQDQVFVGVCVAIFLLIGSFHWARLSGWGSTPLEIDRQVSHRYDYKIDINKAELIEWTQIEGIGEATAQKILDDRVANGPFRNIDDLKRVKGIGPATLAKIRPFLRDAIQTNSTKSESLEVSSDAAGDP